MDSTSLFIQLLFNSLIAGAIYALVASGFSVIYATCRIVHFAHGSVVMLSAYVLYYLYRVTGLSFAVAAILAVMAATLAGLGMNRLIYKRLRQKGAGSGIVLIAGFSLLLFLESLIQMLFGSDIKTIGFMRIHESINFYGAIVTVLQAAVVGASVILFTLLFLLLQYSRTGRTLRAVADNTVLAEIYGIHAERIYSLAFFFGSGIGGIAGILISLELNLSPTMGTMLVIKGFTSAVVGGIGTVYGSIIGALFLGFAENFGTWFFPSAYKDAVAFVILLLFLLIRPHGILGRGEK
jgi:branched-chain amino acid transport system permease protein